MRGGWEEKGDTRYNKAGGKKRAAPESRPFFSRPMEFPPWDPENRRQPRLTDAQDPDSVIRNEWTALYDEYRAHYNAALQRGMDSVDLLAVANIMARQHDLRERAIRARGYHEQTRDSRCQA